MSYKVLARKWRPQHFRDMLGQEQVLRALTSALDTNRLHHAYLFTGMRGVGKTTIARIFAKCLNCETNGVTSDPCGTCSACQDIDAGRFFDLIEVDAASRTKVESTRELLENVPYAPASGRFKVYLIDEVHMFSNHSFNALLKTLEEPPEHVKFVLATTDPQKVPATVLSRCLQFNLKRMSSGVLCDYLAKILDDESIEFERSALVQIARASEGSVRDSLSLVEQAVASGEGAIRALDVESMLGRVSTDRLLLLLETLNTGDINGVFSQVAELAQYAPDYADLLGELLSLVHRVAMLHTVPGSVDNNAPDLERLSALASAMDADVLQLFYQIGLHARRDMPFAPDQREAFDMALLRMHEFKPQDGFAPISDNGAAQPSSAPLNSGSGNGGSANGSASSSFATTSTETTTTANSNVEQAEAAAPASATSAIPKEALAAAFAVPGAEVPKGLAVRGSVSAGATQASGVVQNKPAPNDTPDAEQSTQPLSQEVAQAVSQPPPANPIANDIAPSTLNKAAIKPSDWPQLVHELDIAGMPAQLASQCVLVSIKPGAVLLNIEPDHEHLIEKFQVRLTQALSSWLGDDIKLTFESVSETLTTPAVLAKKKADDELAAAHHSIKQDPIVQQLVERVDAAVDESSIRPMRQSSQEP